MRNLLAIALVALAGCGPSNDEMLAKYTREADEAALKADVLEQHLRNAGVDRPLSDSALEQRASPTITLAEFEALRTGMSHDEVRTIVGSSGQLVTESELAGIHTAMYQFEGEGSLGANANVMFQNGKLIQKAQLGLK